MPSGAGSILDETHTQVLGVAMETLCVMVQLDVELLHKTCAVLRSLEASGPLSVRIRVLNTVLDTPQISSSEKLEMVFAGIKVFTGLSLLP